MKDLKPLTIELFLQGVLFRHKFYEQVYKYNKGNEFGAYLVKQSNLMEIVEIHSITENSFIVNELVFDTIIDVEVFFADCNIVEK